MTRDEMIKIVSTLSNDEVSTLIGVCSNRVLVIGNWYTKEHVKDTLEDDVIRDMSINEVSGNGMTLDSLYESLLDGDIDTDSTNILYNQVNYIIDEENLVDN